jgi:hypothetical protein
MLKRISSFLFIGMCVVGIQERAGAVDLDCYMRDEPTYVGCMTSEGTSGCVPVKPSNSDYNQQCTNHFNCGSEGCVAAVASSSANPEEGPMRTPTAPDEENMRTLSSPTTPTEEDRTQTYAPPYQPQEEQTQNFQRSVTQGEEAQVPSDPRRNLKLVPIEREAVQE